MNKRPYHRLLGYYALLAGAVYICAMIVTAAVVFKNMETNGEAKRAQLTGAAQHFREHVDRIFGNIDWIIETARNVYLTDPADKARLEKTLVALGDREEFAFFITVVDTHGFSVASSLRTSRIDLRDRLHVSALMAPDAPAIYISHPRLGQRTGILSVNISRRIFDEDGAWRGVVIVSFDPVRMGASLKRFSIDGTGVATLIRNDGVVLVRSSPTPAIDQSRFDPSINEALQQQSGAFVIESPIDNVRRLFAFEKLTRLPLTVIVGLDYEYFDKERTEWLLLSALWMGLLALSLAGIGFLIRKFVLVEESRHAQRLAEAERAHAVELIQSSFNSAGVVVIVFDRGLTVRFANNPARELLESLATPLDKLLRSLQPADRGTSAQLAPATSQWVRMRDGSMRTICWSTASAEWVSPDCLVAVGFDRTDAENVERMLNQKARLTAIGEMTVGIAHEVAQPLTIINFTARRMERDPDRSEIQKEGLEVIKSAATRAGRLLAQIKTFSKQYDNGQGAIFDVGECVGAVALLMGGQLENSRIALRIVEPGRAIFARGDPHLFEQIVLNLALNARDAILDAASERGVSYISIAWSVEGGIVRVRVSDSGPGIPPAAQARIFEPFFTTKKGGTGLGLSLSFAMARQLGGSLSLEPSARGAVFVIELPHVECEAEDETPEPAAASA